MTDYMYTVLKSLLAVATVLLCFGASAQEALIRKNLVARIPNLKPIDEVTKTDIPGLYELRLNGTEIYYTDAQGNYLIEGSLIDTRASRNLTEERVNKLTAFKFDDLPIKDAVTIVRGNGKRKMAVFEDPNCGPCKILERNLQKIDNVTIHVFLYPILGPDSGEKSNALWCAKDQSKAWQDWMVRDQTGAATTADCDNAAVGRNVKLGQKHKVNSTPTMVFIDGTRVPGAADAKSIEKMLSDKKG